jgi:predicted nucleotidyltransferase
MNEMERIKAIILPILRGYGVSRAGLFGSCVRGEMTPDSDIDILVEIDSDINDTHRLC